MPLLPKVVFNYKVCTIYNKWNILIFIMNKLIMNKLYQFVHYMHKLIKDYKIYLALIVVDRLIRENELNSFLKSLKHIKKESKDIQISLHVCVYTCTCILGMDNSFLVLCMMLAADVTTASATANVRVLLHLFFFCIH